MRYLSLIEVSTHKGKMAGGIRQRGISSNPNYGNTGGNYAKRHGQSIREVGVIPVWGTVGHGMEIGPADTSAVTSHPQRQSPVDRWGKKSIYGHKWKFNHLLYGLSLL